MILLSGSGHGGNFLSDEEFDMLFTKDKPIIFAFHGYPTMIHELTYRRYNRQLLSLKV